ncbi:flavodoxin family protein [bacterium]|nr:flavodoxin family protein [bacterium]
MKILIFNGCDGPGIKNIEVLLPDGSQVIHIRLNEQHILHCAGCMSCVWNMDNMNPGYCILNDDMKFIYPTFVHSDLVIFMTDVVFGGFSFQLKKVVDRLLPALFTAPLKKRGNDVGHIMRYKKRPAVLGIGIQKEQDKEKEKLFKEYISRISTLWDVPYADSHVCTLDDGAENDQPLIQKKILNWVNTVQ